MPPDREKPIGAMRVIPLATILAAFAASVLHAEMRSCRVVYPERPRGAPKIAYLFDGKESLQTALPSKNLAPVIELPGGELNLAMTAGEVDDPGSLPPEAPRLRIPEGVKDFYILVTHDPDNPHLPVKMELVDPADSTLMPGEMLWINRTDHRIIARLGDSEISMKPRSQSVCKGPLAKSGYYDAEFAYQVNGEGPEARITEQRWWHDTESRHLGFVVDTGDMLPLIFFFRDFRAPK